MKQSSCHLPLFFTLLCLLLSGCGSTSVSKVIKDEILAKQPPGGDQVRTVGSYQLTYQREPVPHWFVTLTGEKDAGSIYADNVIEELGALGVPSLLKFAETADADIEIGTRPNVSRNGHYVLDDFGSRVIIHQNDYSSTAFGVSKNSEVIVVYHGDPDMAPLEFSRFRRSSDDWEVAVEKAQYKGLEVLRAENKEYVYKVYRPQIKRLREEFLNSALVKTARVIGSGFSAVGSGLSAGISILGSKEFAQAVNNSSEMGRLKTMSTDRNYLSATRQSTSASSVTWSAAVDGAGNRDEKTAGEAQSAQLATSSFSKNGSAKSGSAATGASAGKSAATGKSSSGSAGVRSSSASPSSAGSSAIVLQTEVKCKAATGKTRSSSCGFTCGKGGTYADEGAAQSARDSWLSIMTDYESVEDEIKELGKATSSRSAEITAQINEIGRRKAEERRAGSVGKGGAAVSIGEAEDPQVLALREESRNLFKEQGVKHKELTRKKGQLKDDANKYCR